MKNQVQVLPDLIAVLITFIDRAVDQKPEKVAGRQTEKAWEASLHDFAFSTSSMFKKCLETLSVFFFFFFSQLKKRIKLDCKQLLAFMLAVIRRLLLLDVANWIS